LSERRDRIDRRAHASRDPKRRGGKQELPTVQPPGHFGGLAEVEVVEDRRAERDKRE